MKLVIAEKPSLARAIRDVVGKEYTVTNAFGHIYEQAGPDDYLSDAVPKNTKGKKNWRMQDLPIIPTTWIKHPKPDAKEQIGKIRTLLKEATEVVNAGDPDREGQLLIDEILEELHYKGAVKRVWLKSLTPAAIQQAFNQLKPNTEYAPLCNAATARSHADWLVGMNLTRAWTIQNGSLISIGRVQTPTLALIVRRDESIENFKSHTFFEIFARIQHQNGSFLAKWKPADNNSMIFDADGRLVGRRDAEAIALKANGRGIVTDFKSEQKAKIAPLPYSLGALQKAADAELGIGAQAVLDIAQELYESQYTTYPRTDCRYLAEDQLAEVHAVAKRLAVEYGVHLPDTPTKHLAFNSAKISAHTAIVPTSKVAQLTGNQAKVYEMIARSTMALFMPAQTYLHVQATIQLGNENWGASGKKVKEPGWTAILKEDEPNDKADEIPLIPVMAVNDTITATGADIKTKKTTAPARFTEGTLIDAMSNIHRYIEDPAAKATLKETAGIGTEATRANVIETLFKRSWLEKKGKHVISTISGRLVVNALPSALTDPVITAQWEDSLTEIAAGKTNPTIFEQQIIAFVTTQVGLTSTVGNQIAQPGTASSSPKDGIMPCPVCGKTARRLESKKKKGTFYWACQSKEHGLMTDDKGKPGALFK